MTRLRLAWLVLVLARSLVGAATDGPSGDLGFNLDMANGSANASTWYVQEERVAVTRSPLDLRVPSASGPYLNSFPHQIQFLAWDPTGRYAIIGEGQPDGAAPKLHTAWFMLWSHDEEADTWALLTQRQCDSRIPALCQAPFFWPKGKVSWVRRPLDGGRRSEVFSVSLTGGDPRPVALPSKEFHDIDVGPEEPHGGSYVSIIQYDGASGCERRLHVYKADGEGQVDGRGSCVVEPDDRQLCPLSVQWSPRGDWLTFLGETSTHSIFMFAVSRHDIEDHWGEGHVTGRRLAGPLTGAIQRDGAAPVAASAPHVAADADGAAQWAYFSKAGGDAGKCIGEAVADRGAARNSQIFRVRLDAATGDSCQQLSSGTDYKYYPVPTPDGKWVSFVALEGKRRSLKFVSTSSPAEAQGVILSVPQGIGIALPIEWRPGHLP
jgi:hypothetical protein